MARSELHEGARGPAGGDVDSRAAPQEHDAETSLGELAAEGHELSGVRLDPGPQAVASRTPKHTSPVPRLSAH
ncbi:hypothetical protein [Sorangium atrum]|uniref:Uncharacterized protein n=1 Tax=Sorangium atrum TaxID=2995308 RepID=A0ABT5CGQ3_9BACT|nr:hypothetical protein [Sorangium aterium]MDC0684818.1 hypothetical protein [Sorangium aterium]